MPDVSPVYPILIIVFVDQASRCVLLQSGADCRLRKRFGGRRQPAFREAPFRSIIISVILLTLWLLRGFKPARRV